MRDWKDVDVATVQCRCYQEFRAKAQVDYKEGGKGIISERPCPKCGATEGHRRMSMDPERWTV